MKESVLITRIKNILLTSVPIFAEFSLNSRNVCSVVGRKRKADYY